MHYMHAKALGWRQINEMLFAVGYYRIRSKLSGLNWSVLSLVAVPCDVLCGSHCSTTPEFYRERIYCRRRPFQTKDILRAPGLRICSTSFETSLVHCCCHFRHKNGRNTGTIMYRAMEMDSKTGTTLGTTATVEDVMEVTLGHTPTTADIMTEALITIQPR